jgi:Protein of unknown function (DUF2842)
MRSEPNWRIPFGMLLICAGLAVYGIAIARWLAPWFAGWPVLAQLPVYVVLGVVWILPLRRFLAWMETGRWG